MCKIYDTRPEFCKVDKVRYKKMFEIDEEDFNVSELYFYNCMHACIHVGNPNLSLYNVNIMCVWIPGCSFLQDFCAFCCREQIADVYGEDSNEMDKFEDVQEFLE